ncbi:glycosyl transferase family 2 [Bacillus manliponensis]|uniref:Glycosyl transferase family 2 n=1 Tax=Bacillus manliponensis TaxID=574376 RepID=A0A073JYU5_9BACI|nr:glycosyltransferase family 2 protein [Bacillus manliponensis]KEK20239.1 glycosyl transferase family 2 [Bacillus manliponensis]
MPILSIIIPIFNVEKYLDKCLGSILNQDFNDYEIILVNNGSTDSSGEICDIYASEHNNIKVVHLKKNLLPAGARNIGLLAAVGEYIHFCDSDDYYVAGSFSRIADLLYDQLPSVLMGQFICAPEKGAFICNDIQLNPEVFTHRNASIMAEYLLSLPNMLYAPWRLIAKRALLISNKLTFPEGCHSEDEEWFPKVICSAGSFALLTEPFYYYRPRVTGSVTSSKTFLNSKSHLAVAINLLRFLYKNKYTDARRDFIYSRVNFLIGLFATRCDTFNTKQLHELADLIENNLDLLPMLDELSYSNHLFEFINNHGSYIGVCLYQTLVIKTTLKLIYGKENKDIYIFPTGYNGEGTARILKNAGYNVKGFIDNSILKNECTIDELPVNLPSILKNMPPEKRNHIFVMVTTQRDNVAQSVMKQLSDLGLDKSQFVSRIY